MKISRPAVVATAALLALLTLSACSPGTPTPTPPLTASATPTDEPEPEPTAAAADRPPVRFGATCASLVPTALLTPILPFTFEANDLVRSQYLATPDIPRNAAVAQLGGLVCEWSNGEPYSSQVGSSAFRGIQLSVLPEAADGWEFFTGYYDVDPVAGSVSCSAESGACSLDVFADGYWFSADIATTVGPGTEAAVVALAGHLRSAVAGFGPLAARWYPAGLETIPVGCGTTLPESVVSAVYGSGHDLYNSEGEHGGWSVWAEAWTRDGGFGCGWFGESEAITVSWLTGGAWLAEHLGVTANGVAVEIPGLGGDGIARQTSYGDGSSRIDLVAHGTWVTMSVAGSADPATGVRLLANHVAGLYAP